MQQLSVALTRRPVKDKGALMQTLHLWFRDLRAISLRQGLSRWRTPSDAMRAGMKGPPALSNSPGPTLAVGSRPAISHQRLARCPTVGAGLPLASPLREVSHPGADAPSRYRVCPWQASASEVHCTPLAGLSFPLVPRRGGARSSGEKTADPVAHVRAWAGVSGGVRRDRSHHGRGVCLWPATTSP